MAFLSSASKATKITLGILAAAILMIGVVPYLITWNRYKGLITDKVAAALGRDMQIDGNIRFSILPRPEAHLSKILIKNPAGASSENFLQVEQLDVAVALFPLLKHDIAIEKITLDKPAITLEKMADGGNNWTFTPTQKKEAVEAAKENEASTTNLQIDDIELKDAYIRYVDATAKSVQTVGPINANLNLGSLAGPYGARGELKYNNLPVLFDATIGAPVKAKTGEEDATTGMMPVKATIGLQDKAATLTFSGSISRGDTLSVSGDLAVQANDLGAVLNAIAPATGGKTEKPALPAAFNAFNLQSKILYSGDKLALPGLQIKGDGLDVIADTVVTMGGRTNVTTDIGRFVLPISMTGGDASATDATAKDEAIPLAHMMQDGFASAQGILNIGFPTTPLDVIVTADSLTLPGKPPLRDLRLAASSDASVFTLQSLQAKLNGNTRLNVTARAPLNAAKKADSLSATLTLNSDNPALAFSTTPAPAQKAEPLAVSATALLTRQALKIEPLQVTQQGQTLNGSLNYQPNAAMPLNLTLRGGALDLDSLTGKSTSADTTTQAVETVDAKSADASILNRLQGFKAQFDVAIDRVTTGGKNFANVLARGVFSETGLNLQAAQANLEGLALNARGTVGKLSPVGDLDLEVSGGTTNLSQTLKNLGNAQAGGLGNTAFGGTVKGDLAKIALNVDAKIDQGTAKVNGNVLRLDQGQAGFDGTIEARHPDTALIMRNFAKMDPAAGIGPFAVNATVKYGDGTIKADDLTVKLGNAGDMKGSINLAPQPNGQKNIDAQITAGKLNLAALMGDAKTANTANAPANANAGTAADGWSRDPLDLDMIRTLNGKITVKIGELLYKDFVIRDFNNDLAFAGGTLKLNDLSANLFDAGRMVVNGTLTAAAKGQAHKGQFNLNIQDTDAAKFFKALDSELFTKGSFSAQQQLNFTGSSPYQMINALNGDGQFKLRDAVANGIDLDALAAKLDRPNSVSDFTGILQQAKAGGTTDIGSVDVPVSIRNGLATIPPTPVKTKLTSTTFGGMADLPAKTVNMNGQIVFTEQRNLPPLGLKITGPFASPRKEFDTASIGQFFLQKTTGKYQDKVTEKLDKLIGDKIPGGAGGALGGALNNLLGRPTPTPAPAPVTAPAPVATPAPSAPVAAPVAEPAPAPAPAAETPTPAAETPISTPAQ